MLKVIKVEVTREVDDTDPEKQDTDFEAITGFLANLDCQESSVVISWLDEKGHIVKNKGAEFGVV